jgi:hypothetical protein
MSKAQSRAFLPKEMSWDMIGFDGNEVGSLRTHPGFKSIDTFTPVDNVANVIGFFPITVLTSGTTYVYATCGQSTSLADPPSSSMPD